MFVVVFFNIVQNLYIYKLFLLPLPRMHKTCYRSVLESPSPSPLPSGKRKHRTSCVLIRLATLYFRQAPHSRRGPKQSQQKLGNSASSVAWSLPICVSVCVRVCEYLWSGVDHLKVAQCFQLGGRAHKKARQKSRTCSCCQSPSSIFSCT